MKALQGLVLAAAVLLAVSCPDLFDTAPPDVDILSPADSASTYGSVDVVVRASDNRNVKQIDILLDDSLVASRPDDSFGLVLSLPDTGWHEIQARASDRKGNRASVVVRVHNLRTVNLPPYFADSIGTQRVSLRDARVRLTVRAFDPELDSIYIRYFFDTEHSPGWSSGWLGPVASGGTVCDTVVFPRSDAYRVVALARDDKGGVSDTSPARIVNTGLPSIGWIAISENVGAFNYSPVMVVSSPTELTVFCPTDDSVFAFRDTGGDCPEIGRSFPYWWESPFPGNPVLSADNQRIYLSTTCGLYMLSANLSLATLDSCWPDSSRTRWTSPAVKDNLLYCGHGESLLTVIDDGGRFVRGPWAFGSGAKILFPPIVGANGSIFFGNDSGVFSIYPDGNLVWRRNPGGAITCEMAIDAGGVVYAGCKDSRLYSFDPAAGTPTAISDAAGANLFSGGIVVGADGAVYAARIDGDIHCFGPHPWDSDPVPGATISSALCLAPDTTVIVHTDDDVLLALDQMTGDVVWQVMLTSDNIPAPSRRHRSSSRARWEPGSSPTIGPNFRRIYVGAHTEAMFVALTVDKESYSSGLPATPWPKYRHDLRNGGWAGGFWRY